MSKLQSPPPELALSHGDLKEAFTKLLARWRTDTQMTSNLAAVFMHPSHYGIVAMGQSALPYIFEDLAQGGGPWFLALESITQENPVISEHRRSSKLARADWIAWGKEHGYISA